VFKSVGAGSNSLFFSGFFGVAKVIACFLFLSFLVERIGRKGALAVGAALMGALFLIVAVLTVTHPPNPNGGLSSTSVASLVMIYLEASKSPDKTISSCSLGD
jgi:peptidoglycan/LPS O-acetylase OafA/YrhL